MKKNPKIIAGIAALVILAGGLVYMLALDIPMAGEVRREMSLTPTPLPKAPDSIVVVTPDPAQPTAAPELRNGSTGEEVKKLQERLKELGYYRGTVDGLFYNETTEAVIAFQRANQLTPDGVVGEKTRDFLYSDRAVPKHE